VVAANETGMARDGEDREPADEGRIGGIQLGLVCKASPRSRRDRGRETLSGGQYVAMGVG